MKPEDVRKLTSLKEKMLPKQADQPKASTPRQSLNAHDSARLKAYQNDLSKLKTHLESQRAKINTWHSNALMPGARDRIQREIDRTVAAIRSTELSIRNISSPKRLIPSSSNQSIQTRLEAAKSQLRQAITGRTLARQRVDEYQKSHDHKMRDKYVRVVQKKGLEIQRLERKVKYLLSAPEKQTSSIRNPSFLKHKNDGPLMAGIAPSEQIIQAAKEHFEKEVKNYPKSGLHFAKTSLSASTRDSSTDYNPEQPGFALDPGMANFEGTAFRSPIKKKRRKKRDRPGN
jgi:hypothetical protein